MFTGIVTDIGRIETVERRGDLRARIACGFDTGALALGASVACDGVCLTVVDRGTGASAGWFDVDVSAETLSKSTLATGRTAWAPGRAVNLERALRVGDELGGHIVSGHVDGRAEIVEIAADGASRRFVFEVPDTLARFVAPKGSVALNGTSLTVNDVAGSRFGVNVIPHTLAQTTWGTAEVGDLVNFEIDTLARYVARLTETAA